MNKKHRRTQEKLNKPGVPILPFPETPKPITTANAVRAVQVFDEAQKEITQRVYDAAKQAQTVDGFENFLTRTGLMSNATGAGQYSFTQLTRNRLQLEAAYRGSWVVGIAIDAKAEDMTRAGIQISTHEGQLKVKDFMAGMSRLKIMQSFCSGIKWGNLYGGAIAVIQIKGQLLSSPLNLDSIGKDQFQGLVVYDRWQLSPDLANCIDSGPDMGLPEYYSIVSSSGMTASTQQLAANKQDQSQIRLHHSRVIRFTGIDLPHFQAIYEMMWGESIIERLWDRLIAFDNATMASASLIDRANLRMVGVDGLRQILGQGGKAQQGLEAMFEMMRELQSNQGITLLDKNDTYQTTSYSFSGLSDMMLQFGQQISGATGIPLVRFFGQSPSGLSATGEGDLKFYYNNINATQEAKLRNPFEMVIRVMWRSMFGVAAPDDLEFTFTPLWLASDKDKSDIAKANAETIIGVKEAGLIKSSTALKELRQDSGDTGLFSHISDEEIEEADDLDDLPPEPGNEPDGEDIAKAPPKLKVVSNDADFKEGDHPRAKNGEFGTKGAGISKTKKSVSGGKSKKDLTPLSEISKGIVNQIKTGSAAPSEVKSTLSISSGAIKNTALLDSGHEGRQAAKAMLTSPEIKAKFTQLGESHPDLKQAVYDWGQAGYSSARAIQQGNPPKNADDLAYGQSILKGLDAHFDKLPSYEGPVCRDIAWDSLADAQAAYSEGDSFTLDAYTSFTAKSGYNGGGRNMRFSVEKSTKGKAAWGLSSSLDEAEVLVPKNVKYKVVRVEKKDTDADDTYPPYVIVHLEEI
jgi:phage-related protein (TIGR01555 family)